VLFRSDLTQARLNAVAARIDQRIARVRLTHAIGRDADPHKI
jgi:outer membrane protein TolC